MSLTAALSESLDHVKSIAKTREEEKAAKANKLHMEKKGTLQTDKATIVNATGSTSPAELEAATAFLSEFSKKDILLKARRTPESIAKA
jgi:hypothetical protein